MFVKYEDLIKLFTEKLVKHGVEENLAREAATIFADNSRDGVYTHGTNRFPRIIRYIDEKVIDFSKVLTEVSTFNAFAKYDGHRGFGPLNAKKAMQIAIDKAKEYGIGGVCLVNNNHWLRGGTYAAERRGEIRQLRPGASDETRLARSAAAGRRRGRTMSVAEGSRKRRTGAGARSDPFECARTISSGLCLAGVPLRM